MSVRQAVVVVVALVVAAAAGFVAMRRTAPPHREAPPARAPERVAEKPIEPVTPAGKTPEARPVTPAVPATPRPAAPSERIAELLAGEIPADQYTTVMKKIRELLTDRTANAVFISDLPSLTARQMVVLWDVLWLTDEFKKDGFGAFGEEFARGITRRLAELLPTYRDAQQRHLVINMLLPDVKYLTDDELARLKSIAEADTDEYVRKQAAKLRR